MVYQILLVEDNPQIREIIEDYFYEKSENQICISSVGTGNEGLELSFEHEYDLVLLDIMLPGMDGFALCRALRRRSIVPIIFLTARGREEDILYGYDLGCDDYVVKPFSLPELYAKVNALLKRSKGMVGTELLTCGRICVDPVRLTVKVDEQEVVLAPKEYSLLKLLMENRGHVVKRDAILIKIWGYDYEGNDRVVDNHVKKLRKALGAAGKQIKTVITMGYRMEEA